VSDWKAQTSKSNLLRGDVQGGVGNCLEVVWIVVVRSFLMFLIYLVGFGTSLR
jgi:hypothetical protein